MSYLDRPRLTFFGQFTANPSTINNTPANYAMPSDPDPAWNPNGRHNFSLDNCAVTSIVMDGTGPAKARGAVTTAQPGVLVDLDTEQQGVSQIIGMKLTITVGGGSVTGTFQPVNFFDMFIRINGKSWPAALTGDGRFSAAYQTVLTHLQWNEKKSAFLIALKAASPAMLSLRMNVSAFHDGTTGEALFTKGRVAGTIGPQFDGEPTSFTNARYLRPTGATSKFGSFNFAQAKVSPDGRTVTIDLGNAIPTTWPKNTDWPVAVKFPKPGIQIGLLSTSPPQIIGTFDSSQAAYQSNAFVQEFTSNDPLGAVPLGIVSPEQGGLTVMAENPTGAFINAGQYVVRMNPGDSADITLWANTFGEPAANIPAMLYPNISGLQPVPGIAVGTPPGVLSYPSSVTTDNNGRATFTIKASNPNNPRGAIDGQVYGVGWTWANDVNPDPNAFVSVHVFDSVPVPETPTWWQDVYPILNQYSYLYPAMQQILAINDYNTVVENVTVIIGRLTLPEDNPGYMPITRELSRDKLAILLKWANDPQHPQGTPPAA